jgi:hypothetical protein
MKTLNPNWISIFALLALPAQALQAQAEPMETNLPDEVLICDLRYAGNKTYVVTKNLVDVSEPLKLGMAVTTLQDLDRRAGCEINEKARCKTQSKYNGTTYLYQVLRDDDHLVHVVVAPPPPA